MVACLVQIKKLPAEHNCPSTKLRETKMATQGWCADRLFDWINKNSHKGPKEAKEKYMFMQRMANHREVLQACIGLDIVKQRNGNIWFCP